jgi:hypothetical protein
MDGRLPEAHCMIGGLSKCEEYYQKSLSAVHEDVVRGQARGRGLCAS